jgi:hypothetical protein
MRKPLQFGLASIFLLTTVVAGMTWTAKYLPKAGGLLLLFAILVLGSFSFAKLLAYSMDISRNDDD